MRRNLRHLPDTPGHSAPARFFALFAAMGPSAVVSGYWLGGEGGLLASCVLITAATVVLEALRPRASAATRRDADTGLPTREAALALLEELAKSGEMAGRRTAVIAVGFDNPGNPEFPDNSETMRRFLAGAADRVSGAVRKDDLVVRLSGTGFGIILRNLRRADLEMLIQISSRIQHDVSGPVLIDRNQIHPTISIGFCLPNRSLDKSGAGLLAGAERALAEARRETGGAIRAYSGSLKARVEAETQLAGSVAEALERGDIRPWLQPQISARTGEVTGFEALSRWETKDDRLLVADDYVPVLDAAGLAERHFQTILSHTLAALSDWDSAGLGVPGVSLSVRAIELRSAKLVDQVRWELDRFEIEPHRLTLAFSEGMVHSAEPENRAAETLAALSRLGCRIDLDKFGEGSASLGDMQHVQVSRLRIGRGFVADIDSDTAKQRLVTAVLSLASNLGVETLASGVDTQREEDRLTVLGCDQLQGHVVAPPMRASDVANWLTAHAAGGHVAFVDEPPEALRAPKTA